MTLIVRRFPAYIRGGERESGPTKDAEFADSTFRCLTVLMSDEDLRNHEYAEQFFQNRRRPERKRPLGQLTSGYQPVVQH